MKFICKLISYIINKANTVLKNKLGYFFYKSSIIKYSTYDYLKNHLNLPEASKEERNILDLSKNSLRVSEKNCWSILQSIKYIYDNNIQGDFVESGIYEGNSLIIFELAQRNYNLSRKIYGFDTFEGMVEPSSHDKYLDKNIKMTAHDKYTVDTNWMKAPYDIVVSRLKKYLQTIENIKLVRGDVRKTLLEKENLPEKISLLRLDTDFYESTKEELKILYPKLAVGGILIIDDYGFLSGSKKAVDEYLQNENLILFPVDNYTRICIKK